MKHIKVYLAVILLILRLFVKRIRVGNVSSLQLDQAVAILGILPK